MVKFKNNKTIITGMNGSGKTEFGKHIAKNFFKRPIWVLVNIDDLKGMPKNVEPVLMAQRSTEELNDIVGTTIQLAKEKKVDAIFIDEADLFINDNTDLKKNKHLNDIIILQRHHGLAIVAMTRRPANLPTMLFETSDNVIIFASPRSDNVDRKLKSLDRELPTMVSTLRKGDFKFITFVVGEKPKFNNPIPLGKNIKVKKEVTENE